VTLIPSLARLVLTRIGWVFAAGGSRDAEILALRHQILVLQRQIGQPRFNETDRTILALLSNAMDRTRRATTFLIVQPETVLRWHRWSRTPHSANGYQTRSRPGKQSRRSDRVPSGGVALMRDPQGDRSGCPV
jgi:hypothetical protein